ncbi:MAG TPA: condensation domain-containing protein, partial [Ktedonobacteraceae bacterium]|nr:condensation domain-containing protein [Ktedonobacteraceae bacterium]
KGARKRLIIGAQFYKELKGFSNSQNSTLFMTLLAAFEVLLYRLSGQERLTIGIPIAGQGQMGAISLVGQCVNMVPLIGEIHGEEPFQKYLKRIKRQLLDLYEHQSHSFAQIAEKLLEREQITPPVIRVMFNMDRSVEIPHFEGLQTQAVQNPVNFVKFDLSLNCIDVGGELLLDFDYSTDVYASNLIEHWVSCFEHLLQSMMQRPATPIANMELVRGSALIASATRDAIPLLESIEAQVSQKPQTLAVIDAHGSMTYTQLYQRAQQLASALLGHQRSSPPKVGLWLEQGQDIAQAVLATLLVGGAYVVLDPSTDGRTLPLLIEAGIVSVLVTRGPLDLDLQIGPHVDLEDLPPLTATPDLPAFVSAQVGRILWQREGGQTHWVMDLSWELIAQQCACLLEETGLAEGDVVYQQAQLWYHGRVQLLLPALVRGATLIWDEQPSALELHSTFIARHCRVVALSLPLWHTLLHALEAGNVLLSPTVEQILVDGGLEACTYPRVEWTPERVSARLHYVYGPSHLPLIVFWQRVSLDPDAEMLVPVPMGKTCTDIAGFVLDLQQQPVPMMIPGELYLAFPQAAARFQEESAEQLPLSLSLPDDVRIYRTGDLVRSRPDGVIELLGQVEEQLTFQGQRVHVGEIVATLCQHPTVLRAWIENSDENRLVAYVEVREQRSGFARTLARLLRSRFPNFLLPTDIVIKAPVGTELLDVKQVSERSAPGHSLTSELPRTEIEKRLAEHWAYILGVKQITLTSNFFELGGQSLQATQLVSRIRNDFAMDLPLHVMFETPTLVALAARIEAMLATAQQDGPGLQPVPRHERLPLSFAQQRLWFLDQLAPGSSFYNLPAGLHIEGPIDINILVKSLEELVQRHEVLRTLFPLDGRYPYQNVEANCRFDFVLHDVRAWPSEQREALIERNLCENAFQAFDLAHGPLMRVLCLKLQEQEHMLQITVHHIISDEWSSALMVAEVFALYEAFRAGRPSPLAELPIQYADFAVWQRQWLQGAVVEKQMAYWKEQLAEVPTLLLPTDRPRPAVQRFRGSRIARSFPLRLYRGLQDLSQRQGVTLFMTLLAAFQVLMYRYSGQELFVVGSPIANRNRLETEGLIGFFVNTLALRADVRGEPTFTELLHRTARVAIEAFTYQDLPFERLVEEIQPKRDPSYSPLFQVMFDFLQVASLPSLPGLSITKRQGTSETAKFDLVLDMLEEDGLLRAELEYNTDLFDRETVERMLLHFQILLEHIVVDAEQPVAALPLLSREEQQRILLDWNTHMVEAPRSTSGIHRLVEQMAQLHPDATAVVYQQSRWSYTELDQRANQIGLHLQAL